MFPAQEGMMSPALQRSNSEYCRFCIKFQDVVICDFLDKRGLPCSASLDLSLSLSVMARSSVFC
jgi:hypothetical protein